MLKFISIKENENYIPNIQTLYESSFPEDEQVPFFRLKEQAQTELSDIYAIFDKNEFIAMLCTVYYEDIIFLWYIAVEEKYQNQGYGSLILKEMQERYKEYRLVLNIEIAENQIQLKRKNFYIKNGFKECGFYTEEYGVKYEMLYYGNKITYPEYEKMMRNYSGDEVFEKIYKQIYI